MIIIKENFARINVFYQMEFGKKFYVLIEKKALFLWDNERSFICYKLILLLNMCRFGERHTKLFALIIYIYL